MNHWVQAKGKQIKGNQCSKLQLCELFPPPATPCWSALALFHNYPHGQAPEALASTASADILNEGPKYDGRLVIEKSQARGS